MSTLKKIYVVFKTHFDIGYTALPSEVKATYSKKMIPNAATTCIQSKEKDPQHPYVWTMPSWPLTSVLREPCDNLESLIRNKQILWHALPFTTHTEFCGLEEFIRGMYISQKLSSKFNFSPISAKMTDVPGHTWILPTLLNQAGIQFLHLGCNPCSTPPDVPPLFYWEGPDGSRVLTMYSKGDYGSGTFPDEDWNLPVWLALYNTGDNLGAHSPQIIQDILEEVQSKSPKTQVHFGTLDDFFLALSEMDLQIPVIKKDLADSWIHGVGTYPNEVAEIRAMRNRLAALETVLSLDVLRGATCTKDQAMLIENAYENMLLFGEHTWGIDIKIGLNPIGRTYEKKAFNKMKEHDRYNRAEASWLEKAEYVENAAKLVTQFEEQLLGNNSKNEENNHPTFIKVYNTLAFERAGLIELDISLEAEHIVYDEERKETLHYIHMDNKLYVEVMAIPPLAYKVLKLIKQKSTQEEFRNIAYEKGENICLENDYLSLTINQSTGAIHSFRNTTTGKEWVDSNSQLGFGQFTYDIHSKQEVNAYLKDYAYDLQNWYVDDFGKPGYPKSEHKTYMHTTQKVSFQNTDTYGRITIEQICAAESVELYGNSKSLVTKITLFKDKNYIELSYEMHEKQETPYVESGHFVFPLAATMPSYSINKIGSVIDPCQDIIKDANHMLYCCENWVDICDQGEGLLFVSYDTPLLSIGGNGIERYSGDYVPKESCLYFNAFNNQWGTNFPQWMGGNYKFKYRIMPHDGNWQAINASRVSQSAMVPLLTSFVNRVDEIGRGNRLVHNSLDALEIMVLKVAEDGDGLILRLRETKGKKQQQIIEFDDIIEAVFRCNLLEVVENVVELQVVKEGKRVDLMANPFEIITLRINYRGEDGRNCCDK
ncbi:MAG: DUF5054 domain-containing protein [Vallitaleaceae bacterium]|nr:DUF5054 domain-containing protein [Vallitaleaceae bacterium]